MLTGDTLFVGDIARPDLAVEKREGAQRHLPLAARQAAARCPAECEVWPGHLGGSLCGGPGMDMKVSSTIGYERAHNDLLRVDDEEAFVERATRSLGAAAAELPGDRRAQPRPALTAGGRGPAAHPAPGRAQAGTGRARSSTSAPTCSSTTRTSPVASATRRCAPGSAPSWRGSPTATARSCSSVATTPTRSTPRTSPRRSGSADVAGYLAGGMTSWREEKRPTASIERHRRRRAARAIAEVQVLDVRERIEWDEGHIPGSVHRPYHDIDGIPDGHRPRAGRSRSSAPPDSAAPSPRRCSRGTARVRSSTSPTEASAPGRGSGWPIEGPNQRTASVR